MRKIIIILLFLPLVACNDWLEVESQKSVTLEDYFKSETDLEELLVSMLTRERGLWAPSMVDNFGWSGLYCDNAGDMEGYRKLDPNFYVNVKNQVSWTPYYNIIYLANLMEESRPRFENISSQRADYWIAQANFVKALCYYELACRWGDVPIVHGTSDTEPVAKSPVADVLTEAIRCAEVALSLPNREELTDSYGKAVTSKQYASRGVVCTLLANVYAWMGGLYDKEEYWRKAEEYASEVIEGKSGYYALEGTIALMKKNTLGSVRNSAETIFTMDLDPLDQDRYWLNFFEYHYPGMALINYPYKETSPRTIEMNAGTPRISVDSVLALYSDVHDQRREFYWYELGKVTYQDGGQTVYSHYAFLDKWNEVFRSTNPAITEGNQGMLILMEGDRVVWRLADLILLRAECRAHLGMKTATDDLDRIRERAGLSKYAGATDKSALLWEIFQERERELFGEGQRYFDIVRNGYYRILLRGNYCTLTDEDVANGALYLPVAEKSFMKNPLMKQNIYWLWQK